MPRSVIKRPRLAVLGCGIAGAWAAHLATKQGWQTCCFDPYDVGPPYAMALPKVLRPSAPMFHLHRQAWNFLDHYLTDHSQTPLYDQRNIVTHSPVIDIPATNRQWQTWLMAEQYWPAQAANFRHYEDVIHWPRVPFFKGHALRRWLLEGSQRIFSNVGHIRTVGSELLLSFDDRGQTAESAFDHVIIATGGSPIGLVLESDTQAFARQIFTHHSGAMLFNPRINMRETAVKSGGLAFKADQGCIVSAGFFAHGAQKHRLAKHDYLAFNSSWQSGQCLELSDSWQKDVAFSLATAQRLQQLCAWRVRSGQETPEHTNTTMTSHELLQDHPAGGKDHGWLLKWFGSRAFRPERHPYLGLLVGNIAQVGALGAHGFTLAPFFASIILDLLASRPPPVSSATLDLLDPLG